MPQERVFSGKIFSLDNVGTPESMKRSAQTLKSQGYYTRVVMHGENTAEVWIRPKHTRKVKEYNTRKDSWNTTMTQQMMRRSSSRRARERTIRRDTLTRKPRIKGMTRSGLGTLGTLE